MAETEDQQTVAGSKGKAVAGVMLGVVIFFALWTIIGLIAFIHSLVCMGRSGSTAEKIIGLLLAIFFGPFFYIYFWVNKGYCKTTSGGGGVLTGGAKRKPPRRRR